MAAHHPGRMSAMRVSRREFVQTAAAGGALLAATTGLPALAQDDREPKPIPRRKFERLDLEVPILSQGTVSTREPAVILRGLEWGMNFVHTSAGYAGGQAIRTIAEAIKDRRDEFILGLKCGLGDGELERDLETLGTDHVDLVFYPTVDPRAPKDEGIAERFRSYKDQGMAKGLGLTSHDNVAAVLEAGLSVDWWDVFMPNYQPANADQIDPLMLQARDKGIGGMVMKSWRGVPEDGAARRSVWADMLHKDCWTTICKTVTTEQFVDEMGFFAHNWQQFVDKAAVEQARAYALGRTCTSCGQCTAACPHGLSPALIFRYQMYAAEYGWWEMGRSAYASLPAERRATACTDCGACQEGCRGKLCIPERLREAHRVLA